VGFSGDGTRLEAVAIPASPALQATYSVHRAAVRGSLAHFGVAPADLDDMCHEVFLVVHAQRDQMADVQHVNLWLRAICWRVAAAYRRRSHRRHEIPVDDVPEVADSGSDLPLDEIERHQQREALLRALDKLNDETRDLLALHDLGDVPMTTIAELLECDRKTAHKRLAIARRRLARLLRDGYARREELAGHEDAEDLRPLDLADSSLLNDSLQVLELTPNVNVGLIGNVVITYWPGAAPVKAFEIVESHFDDIAEVCNNRSVYFAIVGATIRPPPLASRKKILELLRTYARSLQAYGTALQGGASWIARPIMTGLSRLVRTEFPMRFFNGIDAAAAWLAPYSRGSDGPFTAAALAAAGRHLTQLQAPAGGQGDKAPGSRRSNAR
jgi:RNA polymerase sigma-70 factor (ECF subfamily)